MKPGFHLSRQALACGMQKICIVRTSAASEADARGLAEKSVSSQLGACAQISGPGESLYHWQGRLRREQEWYLEIKTSRDKCEALMDLLKQQHPYELPEIVCVEADASDEYAGWLHGCLDTGRGGELNG